MPSCPFPRGEGKYLPTDLPAGILNGIFQLPHQRPAFPCLLLQSQLRLVDCLLSLGNHLEELEILGAGGLQFPR